MHHAAEGPVQKHRLQDSRWGRWDPAASWQEGSYECPVQQQDFDPKNPCNTVQLEKASASGARTKNKQKKKEERSGTEQFRA